MTMCTVSMSVSAIDSQNVQLCYSLLSKPLLSSKGREREKKCVFACVWLPSSIHQAEGLKVVWDSSQMRRDFKCVFVFMCIDL